MRDPRDSERYFRASVGMVIRGKLEGESLVTLDDLERICQEGESSTMEFKRELSEDVLRSLSTSLAALANTEGGAMLVGVDDGRQPVGYSPRPRHKDRDRISAEAKNCSPAVQVEFEELTLGKLTFLVIRVSKGESLHCDKHRRFPIRVGSVIQHLDSAGVIAKLQALSPNLHREVVGSSWEAFLGTPGMTVASSKLEFEGELGRPSKPSIADAKLILKALQSEDRAVRGEGLEQLRRLSWDHHAWYDKKLFPSLRMVLHTDDESRILVVLQILRAGLYPDGAKDGKKKAVMSYFRDDVVQLCLSGATTQVRMDALELLKEARDEGVVKMLMEWSRKLDDEEFKGLQFSYVFSNMTSYGYYDRARRRLFSELTAKKSGVAKARVLEMLKALREHGR